MAWAVELSWLVAAAALVVSAGAAVSLRRLGPALHVLLDLLLAAGLLRLSAEASWQTIAVAAGVVALRRVLSVRLTQRIPAAGPPAVERS